MNYSNSPNYAFFRNERLTENIFLLVEQPLAPKSPARRAVGHVQRRWESWGCLLAHTRPPLRRREVGSQDHPRGHGCHRAAGGEPGIHVVSVYSRCYLETRNYHHLRVGMSGSMLAFFFPLNWMFYLTVKNLPIHHFKSASYASGRFPKWLSGWYRICLPSRRHMFDRWVRKDPLEKEMAAHSSILVWEIPWTEEPGRLQSMGSWRVRHDLAT